MFVCDKELFSVNDLTSAIRKLSRREGTHVETWVSVALAFILTIVGCVIFWRMQAALNGISSELGAVTFKRLKTLLAGALLPFLALSAGCFLILVVTVLATRWTRMRLEREQREKQVSDLVLRLIGQSQDENLERISSWLHDEIGHELVLQKMEIEYLLQKRHLEETDGGRLMRQLDGMIASSRNMASMIYPLSLFQFGLKVALLGLIENFQAVSRIPIEHDICDLDSGWSSEVSLLVFRIVQEALTNVGKHANASHVRIKMVCAGNMLQGSVCNDGRSREKDEADKRKGIGIMVLSERAKRLGGGVTIGQSTEGDYCLSFEFPFPATPPQSPSAL